MDTKYFQQALDEYRKDRSAASIGEGFLGTMSLTQLSHLLRRAQELKDADQRKSAMLDRMGA